MGYIDITRTLHPDMAVFPGDAPFIRSEKKLPADDGSLIISEFSCGSHCGTHLDAPLHFIENGQTVDLIAPEILCGPCRVIDVSGHDAVTPSVLGGDGGTAWNRILLKSGDTPENGQSTCLTEEGARFLVDRGCRLVGLEAMSADPSGKAVFPVHRLLLGNGTVILESIDLSRVAPGTYELICCPLKIAGGEGAPARVFLKN